MYGRFEGAKTTELANLYSILSTKFKTQAQKVKIV